MNVLTTLLCAFAVQAPQVPPPRPLLAVPRTPVPFTAALALPSANPTTAADDVARARDNLARLEPARHSLEARLQALEPGIPAAFQLLQREIGFDSYCGVLRGAQGTYAQRAGNALDRALLLATMLGKQGMVVRFARGRLATARCDQLLLRLFEAVEPTDPNLATASAPLRALLDRVQVRAARDYTALQAALGTSSPALAAVPTQAELRDEVQDHFWVQVQQGDTWLDLDPAFLDLAPGQTATAVEQTYAQIPAALHQQLQLRIVVETLVDGAPRLTTTLTAEQPVVDWIDRQVFVLHVADDRLGHGIAGALTGTTGRPYRPVLAIDGELQFGAPSRYQGSTGGGVIDALAAEPETAVAAEADQPFVAEWLELELRCPDGRVELHRRALVDRAGPALRQVPQFTAARLGALPVDAHGPCFCRDVHQVVASSGRHDLHSYAIAMLELVTSLATTPAADTKAPANDGIEALWPFALQTFGWLLIADERLLPALGDAAGVRLYPDTPRLWLASLVHGAGPGADSLILDLRRDLVRGVVDNPAKGPELAARKLWLGTLTGALEHEVLAEVSLQVAGDPTKVRTTSSVQDGTPLRRLDPADLAQVAKLVAAATPAAQITAALQRGSHVVLSTPAANSSDTAFWEIDPAGNTRPVYGLDWNGALLPTAHLAPQGPGARLPPTYNNGGSQTSAAARGGKGASGFRYKGAGRSSDEYMTLVIGVLAISLEVFLIGVACAKVGGAL